jgi:hypothetical protein
MKRLLLVSPHWLPASTPDLQRIRLSLPHYRAHGWEPIVLGVDTRDVEGALEPELTPSVPADIAVHRCRALPVALTRRFGLGNLGWRCLPELMATGERIIRRERIDLVMFSTTQFVTLLAARTWRERTGVPYVVDLQDPWRTSDYELPGAPRPPGGRKYQFARLVAWALEETTFRHAAGFLSVSDIYLTTLRERYAWMRRRASACIPFGASPDDFALARRQPRSPDEGLSRAAGEVHLVSTGAAGPMLSGAVQRLFHAVRDFRKRQPTAAARLRFHFIGSQYAPVGAATCQILPVAATFGVEDLVTEVPHRIGYLAALRRQEQADGLLLLGSHDPAYVPSKLAPYLISGRPLLALAAASGQLQQRLDELGAGCAVPWSPAAPLDATVPEISRFLEDALRGFAPPGRWTPPVAAAHLHYGAAALTAQQCRWFDQICPRSHAASRHELT